LGYTAADVDSSGTLRAFFFRDDGRLAESQVMADRIDLLTERVQVVEVKVDRLSSTVGQLSTRVDVLTTTVGQLTTTVNELSTAMAAGFVEQRESTEFSYARLEATMDAGFARADRKLDQLIDAHRPRPKPKRCDE
jgi:outer membrane murein-binding lipoprotein Lpp